MLVLLLLLLQGISCHTSRTEGLPFSLVFCVPDELLPESNLLLEAMRARCAAAGTSFNPGAVQRWVGRFSQLLQDSSSQAATPEAAVAPSATPLLPPHLASVLDAGEQHQLLGGLAWLQDSLRYTEPAAAATPGSSPAGFASSVPSGAGSSRAAGAAGSDEAGAGSSRAAGAAGSDEAGAGSSGAAGSAFEAGVAGIMQKLAQLCGLVDRLIEADAKHHALNTSSSSSSSRGRSQCEWSLAADKRLLAAMADAGRDYNAMAAAVWGPSSVSPHPKAEACRRRLGCLALATRLLQHARGQVRCCVAVWILFL